MSRMMFRYKNIKETRRINAKQVECPIIGCDTFVDRAKRGDELRQDKFLCRKHGIYISPSTIEYDDERCNLLWYEDADRELLGRIRKVKRESRMARENSEDAVTWNVLRYLEKNVLLEKFLETMTHEHFEHADLVYWSYSCKENDTWSLLTKARTEFGEPCERSSEPDIIIDTPQTLFFIEAKLTADNNTTPSDPSKLQKYIDGGENWFASVFTPGIEIEDVATDAKKYELMRFWLLGSWIAEKTRKKFRLVNLVLSHKEREIEDVFGEFIVQGESKRFLRFEWERIYDLILDQRKNHEADEILDYFREKSIGYYSSGKRKPVPFRLASDRENV